MSAAAGVPILADTGEEEEDDGGELQAYVSEVDYQERLLLDEDSAAAPRFVENEPWTEHSEGLPLKERFLQLLAGAGDSEVQQYWHAIDRWSPSVGVPRGKRGFGLFERDDSSTGSEPAMEMGRRKRRWDCTGAGLVHAGEVDSASE